MTSESKAARTIVVVTGGADGIGRAVVLLCAARGDNVAVLDKPADGAKATAEEALRRGAKSRMVKKLGWIEMAQPAVSSIPFKSLCKSPIALPIQ